MKTQRWIDLSAQAIYLGSIKMADGIDRWALLDMHDTASAERLREIGFLPLEGSPRYDRGLYYLSGDRGLKPSQLAKALGIGQCPIVDVAPTEIETVFRGKCLEKFRTNLNAVTLRTEVVGRNHDGYYVYQTPAGRFVRTGNSEAITEHSPQGTALGNVAFLRAGTEAELRQCAEGVVLEVLEGKKMAAPDLVRFGKAIFGREPTTPEIYRLQEACEAAANRVFARRAQSPDESAIEVASSLYYGLPTPRVRTAESVALQQYSTPLPMSVVAQRLLVGHDDLRDKTFLDPAGGHGALLNLLPPGTKLCALELDPKRVAVLAENPRVRAELGDATEAPLRAVFGEPNGFDYVIANPPFGSMAAPQAFKPLPAVERIDHYIALRALQARKDTGRAVLLVGADGNRSDGSVKGRTKAFLNYLYDHYEVAGCVELDGRLYARLGAAYNVRLIVVGDKRAQPQTSQVPEKLPILTTYGELWQWAGRVIEAYPVRRLDAGQPEEAQKAPWELTGAEWSAARARLREPTAEERASGRPAVARITALATLAFGVTQWYHERARRGDPRALEWIDLGLPPTHRDVIVKALEEKQPVPDHVLAEYPEFARAAPAPRGNAYQVPYQPASKAPLAVAAMVPINMAGATYAALRDLEATHGPVDTYVAKRLRYSETDILSGRYFDAAQIDALALAIKAIEEGRGVINADQTGFGKGRFIAAMMRHAKLNGQTPIFMTIKPELFTDIFRDIEDTGSREFFKRLFIFNEGVHVMKFGTEDEVLYRATSPQERRRALDTGEIDPATDLVLTTYSQFQRAAENNRKSQLLTELSKGDAVLFMDESHVAAGASNTGAAVGEAKANCKGVVYSSATPLKGVTNFSLYSRVFPASVDLERLPDTLKSGGEALQEAISANMARDGVLIRRELDFSKLVFNTRMPDEVLEQRNIDLANKVAAILARMCYLSGDVAKVVDKRNAGFQADWEAIPEHDRKGGRMRASSMNFGSRLYAINRQFLLGIKIDSCVQTALDALQAGRKPVIAVENTGEALLREVIARRAGVEQLEAQLAALDQRQGDLTAEDKGKREHLQRAISKALRDVRLETPPQFRELLEIMLDRIGKIRVVSRYGEVSEEEPSSKEYAQSADGLLELIRELPDLPLAPLDVVRHELGAQGYSVTEVSGRTLSLSKQDDDGWAVDFHPKADAVASVAGFQSGKHDAIIITRSGSTGISLHATDRLPDSDIRQRDFIVLQKAANIAEFLQWLGRVNRKDQVIEPVITILESGLPAELRLAMMHNAKLRKLSANTTSNRENNNSTGDDHDLLNDVGDSVALSWLFENPEVAEYLDIDLPRADGQASYGAGSDCPYVNKLLGRLAMVEVDKQREILDALMYRFGERLEELEEQGINPFKVKVYEWGATVESEEELQSGVLRPSDSTFDSPVKIARLSFEEEVRPVRSEELLTMIRAGTERYQANAPVGESGSIQTFTERLGTLAEGYLRKQLPAKLRELNQSVAEIRGANDLPQVERVADKQSFLFANLEYFRPGASVVYSDFNRGELQGVAISVRFPSSRDDPFLLSKYTMEVMFPGEEESKELSLATLFNQGYSLLGSSSRALDPEAMDKLPYRKEQARQVLQPYDDAPSGQIPRTATVLQGNIFRACELAYQQRIGAAILFSDAQGNRQRVVLVKSRIAPEAVKALPIGMDAQDIDAYVTEHLRAERSASKSHRSEGALCIYNAPVKDMERGEGILLESEQGGRVFRLTIPGRKSAAGPLMTDGSIFDIGEKTAPGSLALKLTGTRAFMSALVGREQLLELMQKLQAKRHVGKFYLPHPREEVLKALKTKFEEEHRAERTEASDLAIAV